MKTLDEPTVENGTPRLAYGLLTDLYQLTMAQGYWENDKLDEQACFTVFFRDVMHLWSVVITAWTYITPIFWTTDFVAQMPHLVRILVYANPMYNYLQFMRDIFLFQTTPSLMTFGMCVAWAVLALIIGYTVFHKSERKFILYI